MNSVMAIVMLVLTGFFIGGIVSFVRNKRPLPAAIVGTMAVMSAAATVMWWS